MWIISAAKVWRQTPCRRVVELVVLLALACGSPSGAAVPGPKPPVVRDCDAVAVSPIESFRGVEPNSSLPAPAANQASRWYRIGCKTSSGRLELAAPWVGGRWPRLATVRQGEQLSWALQVVDPSGQPLPGVALVPLPSRRTSGWWEPPRDPLLVDEAGRATSVTWLYSDLEVEVVNAGATRLVHLAISGGAPGFKGQEIHRIEIPRHPMRQRVLKIVDIEGRAIEGAMVVTRAGRYPLARSDAAGEVRGSWAAVPLELTVTYGGTLVDIDLDATSTETKVTLPRPSQIRGRVVDATTGVGIGAALVYDRNNRAHSVVADAGGRFVLNGPVGGELGAVAAGYEDAAFVPGSTTAPVDVRLEALGSIQALVVAQSGDPLANSTVELLESQGSFSESLVETVAVDAGGRATFVDLSRRSSWLLRARAPGRASAEMAVDFPSETRARTARFELVAGLVVEVAVESDQGLRLDGAIVEACVPRSMRRPMRAPEPCRTLQSRGDGVYVRDDFVPGRFDLQVVVAGFAPKRVEGVEVPDSPSLEALEGEEPVAIELGTIVVEPAVTVSGVVEDARGRPIAAAVVAAREVKASSEMPHFAGEVTTEEDGVFRLTGFSEGEAVVLNAASPSHPVVMVTVTAPATNVAIVLEAGRTVSGRVVDDRGQALSGVRLVLRPPGEGFRSLLLMAVSQTDGTFSVGPVLPGRYEIGVWGPGAQPVGVDVEPDRDLENVVIEIQRPDATITGVVVDGDGLPVSQVEVSVPPGSRARTDALGLFHLDGVAPGKGVVVTAKHRDGRQGQERREVVRGDRLDVRIVLADLLVFSGRVVDRHGAPIEGASVEFVPPFAASISMLGAGAFEARLVGPRELRLYVVAPGFRSFSGTVEADESGQIPPIELEPPVVVAGRLTGADPAEVQGARVYAAADGQMSASTTAAWDTSWSLDLAPGSWTINAVAEGGHRGAVSLEVGAVAISGVEIELAAPGERRGRVVVDGLAYGGARVYLRSAAGGWGNRIVSGTDGAFVVAAPAGELIVTVSSRDERWEHATQVPAQGPIEIAISTAPLRLVVTDGEGLPQAGLRVALGLAETRMAGSRTDAGGHIDLGSMPRGSYEARIEGVEALRTFEHDGRLVTLVIEPIDP